MFEQNGGHAERIFRSLVGGSVAVLAAAGLFFPEASWPYWAILALGAGTLVNGLSGRCGFYATFGLSSCEINPGKKSDRSGETETAS